MQVLILQAPSGSPIRAYKGGIVKYVGLNHETAGNYVEIDHGKGLVTRYLHCTIVTVDKGQKINPGQEIATVGTTGNSSGPHLHFEVRKGGIARNPERYLNV